MNGDDGMQELERLIARCKGSVSIEVNEHDDRECQGGHGVTVEVNEHRSYYQEIREWFSERVPGAPEDVIARCIEADCVVVVHAYPHTPIGFYATADNSADAAVRKMHEVLDAAGVPGGGE